MPTDAFALADQTVVEALVLSMPPGPEGNCVPETVFAVEACSSATLIEEVTNVRTNIPDEPESISFSIASTRVPPQGCLVDWRAEDVSIGTFGPFLSHNLPWSGQVFLPGPAVPFGAVQVQVLTDVKVPGGFPHLDPGTLKISAFLLDADGSPRMESRYAVDPITVAVNLDCTCVVKQLGMGVVAEAGGLQGAYEAQIRNISHDNCTYNWELRQTGVLNRANMRIPESSGMVQLGPDAVFDFQLPLFIDLPTRASREAQLQLQVWDETGKTCEWNPDQPKKALVRNDLVCIIPASEEAEWLPTLGQGGWICWTPEQDGQDVRCSPQDPGFTMATFGANVKPDLADFRERLVKEVLYPETAIDACFDDRAQTKRRPDERVCGRMGSYRGKGQWTVDAINEWGRDGLVDAVGFPSGCVDAYRAGGFGSSDPTAPSPSCDLIVQQDMAIQCFGGKSGQTERWVTYSQGALSIHWDETSVWSTRTQGVQAPQVAGPKEYP